MNRSKEIEAEWISLAPNLAPAGYIQVPYRVPEGYFQGFYDRLIMAIRTEASGGLLAANSAETFEEESAGAEIESISPLLAGLSRKGPYKVPENYFAQFRVGAEKTQAAQAPVIRMKQQRSWMRMAVAATVTAVILTSAFFYFRPGAVVTVANELAKVSDQDMENFIATQDMAPENAGDSVLLQAAINVTPSSFNENDISDLMSNVSDTELEAYASNDGPDSNLN